MAKPSREIEAQALKLPGRERARLAQRLISSLDQEADADAEVSGRLKPSVDWPT
jgi:hypothetical protein